jgi:Mn-dependent DtxR family transcriptional regulator
VNALEELGLILRNRGDPRPIDLARRLNVSFAAATRTIARLRRDRYVAIRPDRSIFLTGKGLRLAKELALQKPECGPAL